MGSESSPLHMLIIIPVGWPRQSKSVCVFDGSECVWSESVPEQCGSEALYREVLRVTSRPLANGVGAGTGAAETAWHIFPCERLPLCSTTCCDHGCDYFTTVRCRCAQSGRGNVCMCVCACVSAMLECIWGEAHLWWILNGGHFTACAPYYGISSLQGRSPKRPAYEMPLEETWFYEIITYVEEKHSSIIYLSWNYFSLLLFCITLTYILTFFTKT